MTIATATTRTESTAPSNLRRLYLTRFVFAIVWAGLLFSTASSLGALSIALVVIYPVFDVAAAVVDSRYVASGGAPTRGLYLNMGISAVAAIALAVAGAGEIPDVLRVWGVWAIVAGVIQLGIGIIRRQTGGQWPMMLSGGISVLAGSSFIISADSATSLKNIAGYAVLGGIFFLISALRLNRSVAR